MAWSLGVAVSAPLWELRLSKGAVTNEGRHYFFHLLTGKRAMWGVGGVSIALGNGLGSSIGNRPPPHALFSPMGKKKKRN